MTLPLDMLANTPGANQDNVPTWRKAQQQAASNFQTQNQIANSPYSTTALSNPDTTQQARLQQTQQIGQNTTTQAQQSATVRKNIWDTYQQKVFNKQQADAQTTFQQQQTQALKDLQQKYIDQANAIPGNQQYYPGQTVPTYGNGTTGSNQPVTYTGDASQVAQMARNAGFPESAIPTVVAISQAESSGNASATHSNNNGSTDYGLMQINSVHSDLLKGKNWADPQQNLNMAYQVYKDAGGSFSPWSTYNSGAYNKFIGMGQTASKSSYTAPVAPFVANTASGLRKSIITKAETYIGLPYVWGGTDLSKGVDCSGLVQQVYKQFGINMPRVSADQSTGHLGKSTYGVRTSMSNLEPGDLVYFYHSDGQVHHIAIWLGNNQILEAPHTGADVRIRTLGANDKPNGLHLYGLDPTPPSPTNAPAHGSRAF